MDPVEFNTRRATLGAEIAQVSGCSLKGSEIAAGAVLTFGEGAGFSLLDSSSDAILALSRWNAARATMVAA